MKRIGIVLALGLAASGCGDKQDGEAARQIKQAATIKEADFERYAREITDLEYPLYRSLLKASGLEAEIGGPQAAEAALHELMGQLRRQSMGTRADLPRLVPAALGEESGYGFTGLAASSMIGMTIGLLGTSLKPGFSAQQSDAKGKLSIETTDQSVKTHIEMKGTIDKGLDATLSTTVKFDFCPDADGKVDVVFNSKTNLAKQGSKAGANLDISVNGSLFYNDNAELTDRWDADIRIEHAAFNGTGKGSYIDASWAITPQDPTGSGKINRSSSQATDADKQVVAAQQQMAQMMSMMILQLAKKALDEGRCVNLRAASTPAQRSGVKPKTAFTILAEPRSKLDGTPTGGTVVATLKGDGGLDPAGTKVPADATFKYVAPDEKQKSGVVALEARSRRGIGKAELAFDTMARAWSIEGGADEYHATGTICDLSRPFTMTGSGVTNTFTPSGPEGGSYAYKGTMSGFGVWGNGTYKVQLDADGSGGTVIAQGPGSVSTPMGVQSSNGTENYTLTPAPPCE